MNLRRCVFAVAGLGAVVAVAAFANPTPPTVTIPLYGAGFVAGAPADGAPAGDDTRALLQQVLKEIQSLRADVAAIKKAIDDEPAPAADGKAPAKGEASKAPAVLVAAAQKCAECHHANVAATKGGDFAVFAADGKLAQLTDRDKKRVVSRVNAGTMPPPPKALTAEEKTAWLGLFEPAGK